MLIHYAIQVVLKSPGHANNIDPLRLTPTMHYLSVYRRARSISAHRFDDINHTLISTQLCAPTTWKITLDQEYMSIGMKVK